MGCSIAHTSMKRQSVEMSASVEQMNIFKFGNIIHDSEHIIPLVVFEPSTSTFECQYYITSTIQRGGRRGQRAV